MNIKEVTNLMQANINKISSKVGVSESKVQSWIDNPELILRLGIIEAIQISRCIDICITDFIKVLEDNLPAEAWK